MAQTIIIADDDPELVAAVKKELESRGYIVLTTSNGVAVVHMAQKQKVDLIILDVAMPMTSGLESFKRLRAQPVTQKIPVIFLSAMPSADIYPVIENNPHVAHLKKPVDIADLVSLIQQLLPR